MPKVSRYRPEPAILTYIQKQLFSAFALLKDEKEVQQFLEIILTRTEIKMLAKRLAIAKLYLAKENYQTISKLLRVADNTIARISSKLTDNPTIVNMVNQLNQIDQQRRKFKEYTPMDKYLVASRRVENVIDQTLALASKKIRLAARHHKIKSNLTKLA